MVNEARVTDSTTYADSADQDVTWDSASDLWLID